MALLRWGNDSGVTFGGYLRATVDSAIPFPNGGTGLGNFFLGNQCGLDTWCIDLYCAASPNGDRRQINTNTATPITWTLGPSLLSTMAPTVMGEFMTFMGETTNGAAWDGHWRLRHPLLLVELFVHWYPDDRQFAYVEVVIVNSNPANPGVVAFIPANFTLVFDGGNAIVIMAGLADNAPLMAENDWLADGQTRILSGVLCWPEFGGNTVMCRQLAEGKVALVGIDKLHHGGNPLMPPGFAIQTWMAIFLPLSIENLHNWGTAFKLDPHLFSGVTGSQGSQKMIGGPVMLDCMAVSPFYFAGLAQKWPCNFCEADGRQLDPPPAHPQLSMFTGRVHRAVELQWPDNLGKPFEPSSFDKHDFSGPEWEHDFDWTLWAAKRMKGTRALEWLVSARARLTLFTEPAMRRFIMPPSRGMGWFFFKCVEMYRNLTDRALAEQVRQHCVDVINVLFIPIHGGQTFPQSWWSWTIQGSTFYRSLNWQVCVQCLGLRWAGEVFGNAGALSLSAEMAQEIIDRVWHFEGGRWTSRNEIRMDGQPYPEAGSGAFDFFGSPFSIAAMLLANPSHGTANAIWAQLVAEAGAGSGPPNWNNWDDTAWLGSPGVLVTGLPAIVGTASVSVETFVASTNTLAIAGELRAQAGTIPIVLATAGALRIAGVASGSVGTTAAATGIGQVSTSGTASVFVTIEELSITGAVLIAGVASEDVGTTVVSAGANVLGLSGLASVSVGTTMGSAGALSIAATASGSVGTSVAATGAGTLTPAPIAGVASGTVGIGVSASATIRSTEPSIRRRFKRWQWWDTPPLAKGRRRQHR